MAAPRQNREEFTIPVVEERARVSKRAIDTGRGLLVEKRVTTHQEQVSPEVWQERLDVVRVPRDEEVDPAAPPAPHLVGQTLVIPVLEEVAVVERHLRLKEEVHITRERRRVQVPLETTVRAEQVTVTPFDDG